METVTKKINDITMEKQNIKLIDGYFNVSEAKDVIDAVLDIKINHHKLKRLSITEGNSEDLCEYDSGRINELIDAKLDAQSFFNDARLEGKKLKISGNITIEVEE